MGANLLGLPHEMILMILSSLTTPEDILSAQLTCKHLRLLALGCDLLQYKLQLRLAGLEDIGPWPTGVPITSRIQKLNRRQTARSSLQWKFTSPIKVPSAFTIAPTQETYLQAGRIILVSNDTSIFSASLSALVGTSQNPPTDSSSLWNVLTGMGIIKDISTAPEEDLFVVATIRPDQGNAWGTRFDVHLFSASKLEPHPSARSPIVRVHDGGSWSNNHNVTAQIAGDNIGISIYTPRLTESRFIIVDWRSGRVRLSTRLHLLTSSFVFLRQDIILFPHADEEALLVYKITSLNSASDMEIVLVRRLFLPETAVHRRILAMGCEASPVSFMSSRKSLHPADQDKSPFRECPDDTIVPFWLAFDPHVNFISFITHRRALLALIPPDVIVTPFAKTSPNMESVDMAWVEWGPTRTRWFKDRPTQDQIGTLSGQRFLLSFSPPGPPSRLRLFDFNPYNVRKLHAQVSDQMQVLPGGNTRLAITAKSVIPKSDYIFLDDVESELPYCEVEVEETLYRRAWMDDDYILCSKVCGAQ